MRQDLRIFWPTDDDLMRVNGISDLIGQMPLNDAQTALKQASEYKYLAKDFEYTPKILACDYPESDLIVGYILYRKTWIRPNTFEHAQVFVHEDFRGERIATKLRAASWEDIKMRGGDYIISATLDTSHMKSVKQLDELPDGWKIMGRQLNSI